MPHTFDPKSRSIGDVLGTYERRSICVPRFQRGYSWEKAHVTTFWEDVLAFCEEYKDAPKSASYFFGPIVSQDQSDEIILLDGQQRLATTTILFSAIRDAARQLPFPSGKSEGVEFAAKIHFSLIAKEDSEPPFALRLGELDDEFFRKTVQTDPPQELKAALRSHVLIAAAQTVLQDGIATLIKDVDSTEALKRLKLVADAVSKSMMLVAITVEDEGDAYSIFETLNDRGLRLSVPDLLLNLLMRRADSDAERQTIRKKWNDMLENLGKRDIARFLRHMWVSRYGDLKAQGLFAELKTHLERKKINSLEFADWCAFDCEAYVDLLDAGPAVPKDAADDLEGVIKQCGITSTLPLLLAGIQTLSEVDFVRLSRFLAVLVTRHAIVADLNPSVLETALYKAARAVRAADEAKAQSAQKLAAAVEILQPLDPGDELVKERAKTVSLSRSPAIWVTTEIAKFLQSNTGEVGIAAANLEHVFPQRPTAAQWPDHELLQPLLWTLGNLTILGVEFNRKASNKDYALKKSQYYVKSELAITKELVAKYATWTMADIQSRSAEMAEYFVKAFQY